MKVVCSYCGKTYTKALNKVNESQKFGWRLYCSLSCQRKSKSRKQHFRCSNPQCSKPVPRSLSEIPPSRLVFCSSSCAAILNNKTRNLHKPKNYCLNSKCQKEIPRRNKYCSSNCQWEVSHITDEEYKKLIINKIKDFYYLKKRIPFKNEMWGIYKSARRLFGSWNEAIRACGYHPNPVKFACKYIAEDGHKCDSMAEKTIDDWLFTQHIEHEVKIPYHFHGMSADFKIKDTFIEFFGLRGQIKSYDRLIRIKEKLWETRHLKIIKIFPENLYPKNQLRKILMEFKSR